MSEKWRKNGNNKNNSNTTLVSFRTDGDKNMVLHDTYSTHLFLCSKNVSRVNVHRSGYHFCLTLKRVCNVHRHHEFHTICKSTDNQTQVYQVCESSVLFEVQIKSRSESIEYKLKCRKRFMGCVCMCVCVCVCACIYIHILLGKLNCQLLHLFILCIHSRI